MLEKCKHNFIEICKESLGNEINKNVKYNVDKITYKSLYKMEVVELSKKINLLPLEYQNILFSKYYFNSGPMETERVFGIENAKNKLSYIEKMLTYFMGLENTFIDKISLEKACEISINKITQEYESVVITKKPSYSKKFRRKVKEIKIKENLNQKIVGLSRKIAIFILICMLSFSTILVVNAEVRENVFKWVVLTFPKFSVIRSGNMGQGNKPISLSSFRINYIPTGFKLDNINEGRSMLVYNYLSNDNKEIIIKFIRSSDKGQSYYDTENIDIEEINFKGSIAYIWQTDKMTYLIWNEAGIEIHLVGNLSKEEILKVGRNILK